VGDCCRAGVVALPHLLEGSMGAVRLDGLLVVAKASGEVGWRKGAVIAEACKKQEVRNQVTWEQ
jgi:predicted nucleic acid-binding Zn ribbon protein